MTLKELNALCYIEQEIQIYENKIIELREKAASISPNYSGMPNGSGSPTNKIENAVIDIVAYTEMLDKAKLEYIRQCRKIHEYILSVPDPQTRLIMTLRFIERKSWGEIARKIGGNNTVSAVRMRVLRYIEANKGG